MVLLLWFWGVRSKYVYSFYLIYKIVVLNFFDDIVI